MSEGDKTFLFLVGIAVLIAVLVLVTIALN